MKAFLFPGQGCQKEGMGKDLYEKFPKAKAIFEEANDILGERFSDTLFSASELLLMDTRYTQPAIFIYEVALAMAQDEVRPDCVAGHSLGEFSALVANKVLSFEDGLRLVSKRAMAMQKACEAQPGTMAAVIGMEDAAIEGICNSVKDAVVVPANYNCPGQLVISGSVEGVAEASEKLKEAGAKRVVPLSVGGAFHSPLMEPARVELAEAIKETNFNQGICPIYQNVTGQSVNDPEIIKKNLIAQLTSPVLWTQTMSNILATGVRSVVEVGPGTVLQGLFRKMDRNLELSSATV